MKKGYHDYIPLLPKEKEKKVEKSTTGFVTKNIFMLQFGFTYPKTYKKPAGINAEPFPKRWY
jgi:hypothetical protein